MKTFTLTEQHIKLLRRMYVQWCDWETGAPMIDPKRPYGNSFVAGDVAEILDLKLSDDYATAEDGKIIDQCMKLHAETETALQIVLKTGSFTPGLYVAADRYGEDWVLQ